MASFIPGYEYDIFISYRQKDNKGDRWVSEFVDALETELESTFKEDVSVYFDINPHDGLLETHDVDASLKDKLKCLIFIPIISRTYCDPKSFAWEHEFKAFVEQASQDQFGLKIKLPNGNVANRVLPVRIHDLDNEDIKLCESVMGGFIRGVEFIYKSPGVNRPLRSKEEKPQDNLNNTLYRDQINKVANSIREIILGLSGETAFGAKDKIKPKKLLEEAKKERKIDLEKPPRSRKRILVSIVTIVALIIIAAILGYPKIFNHDTLGKLQSSGKRISIVIMPFQNQTNDITKNQWQDWIQDNLITYLSNFSEELNVKQTESINRIIKSNGFSSYASISPAVGSTISQKLDADVLICGSIKQIGAKIHLNTQLINSKTDEVYKSFQLEGPVSEDNIYKIIDSLAVEIKNYLIISKLRKEGPVNLLNMYSTTSSPEAFSYFISGKTAFEKRDYQNARNLFSQALKIDSNFFYANTLFAMAYGNPGLFDEAKKLTKKLFNNRDRMTIQQKTYVNYMYADYFETPNESIKFMKQLEEMDDQIPNYHYLLGNCYNELFQYENAISQFEKALEIYNKWKSAPWWVRNYTELGKAYHNTGQFRKEKTLYRKAEEFYPEDRDLVYRKAVLSLRTEDKTVADAIIGRYEFLCRNYSLSENEILTGIAEIYQEASILDKAEEYFRKALLVEPEYPVMMNNLAYFLIDKSRNINEGLELIDKALQLSPEDYDYLHTKGLGLYKQGHYKEAFDILQKSWDLRMKNAIYDHNAFLHLEAAKKAVASQK